jgi:hypothetical protein
MPFWVLPKIGLMADRFGTQVRPALGNGVKSVPFGPHSVRFGCID